PESWKLKKTLSGQHHRFWPQIIIDREIK
ncbi:MAG: hypothetical protein ACI9LF_001038, partial [Flavobacteriales bacterium]